jgi:hypothetical protein
VRTSLSSKGDSIMSWTYSQDSAQPAFATAEGLRTLLNRLHDAGPGAWRKDPDAAALMEFATRRYGQLARKYELEPEDAAVAAFEVMLAASTRKAGDPWAVVTVAVRITLIAEHRAHGLLTSAERARRPQYSVFHDAERFSDRETDLADYHPAFRAAPPDEESFDASTTPPNRVLEVLDQTTRLLSLLNWPAAVAQSSVDYVTSRLSDAGDRTAAYELLRRDKTARALLDLPHESWIGLLRVILGHPSGTTANSRRGILVRLLVGDSLTDLLADDDVVLAIALANPVRQSVD